MLCGGVGVVDPVDPPPHPVVNTKIRSSDETKQQLRDRMKAREAMNGNSPDQMTWFPLKGEKPGFTVQRTLGGDIRDFIRLMGLMQKVKVWVGSA
jgi:hypothetical protein